MIKENRTLSLELTRFYAIELINTLSYLRKHNIVHRDLKPQNVLIDEKFHIKLADFGAAKRIDPVENYSELENIYFSDDSSNDESSSEDLDDDRISKLVNMKKKLK